MIDLNLGSREHRALVRTLCESGHVVACEAHLLDLDHRSLGRIPRILSGQVNIDAKADITRQLQMEVADPRGVVNLDSPDGRPRLNRMVRVYYMVWVDNPIYDFVPIPVFTGPITKTSRADDILTLEASGKEILSQGPSWRSRTFSKNRNRVAVTREMMREMTGETRFQFPNNWNHRLAKPLSIGKQSSVWAHARAQARAMNAQLFYDGRGNLRLRKPPVRSSFTFRDGNNGSLLTPVRLGEESETLINAVHVTGAIPKGKKKPLEKKEFLPEGHMYSPQNLIRGGKLKYLPEEITDDKLRTQKEVDAKARRRVKEIILDEQSLTFDALPIPFLEEQDVFTVDADNMSGTGRVIQLSLPLDVENASTVGYLANLKRRKNVLRR